MVDMRTSGTGAGTFDLTGRVALITGGNGGIGLAMASALARAGAVVVISGRNTAKGAAALQKLRPVALAARFVEADIANPEACLALVNGVADHEGRLDILVNNAGIAARKRPEDLDLQDWQGVIGTNLTAAFLCCKAAYPAMAEAGGGKIINTGSMMSLFGAPFAAAYGASKGGLVQLTRSLAAAWAQQNIQVNAVLPGWIDTDLTAAARDEVENLHDKVLARTPAGRWGRADDLAGVAVFLASSASDFVTGAVIPVDGGYSIAG